MKQRIICIGHPYIEADQAGPKVYARLTKTELPEDVELIEGGLQGLNLLRCFEQCERVILVDSVSGFQGRTGVVHLTDEAITAAVSSHYDHSAGLAYLLGMLPQLLERLPRIDLIGLEGEVEGALLDEATDAVLELVKSRWAA